MLDLWLVRHGETDWNLERRIQGSADVPLNRSGEVQAQRLGERLAQIDFDRIIASDLLRTRHTAEIAFPDRIVDTDRRLREIDMGRFEGLQWDALSDEERSLQSRWFAGPYHLPVPGGESSDDLKRRVAAWVDELPPTGRVLAVTHGGTIASALHFVVGRPQPRAWNGSGGWSFRLDNTSVTRLQIIDHHVIVKVVNDSSHLDRNGLDRQ